MNERIYGYRAVKSCPKCGAASDDARRRFIYSGEFGQIMCECRSCAGCWHEETADTPPYASEAWNEVDAILRE